MARGDHLDENRLVDFTERLLADAERAEVEGHLDECPDCRSLVAEVVRSDSVCSLPEPPVSVAGLAAGEPLVLHRGSTLGRYVILERLGAGGMGVVYAAFDPQLDRKVSLKLLRNEVAQGASATEARSRLLREAQAMARLSHPNVIAVHDVGTFAEQVFFAMEFVDGGTLTHWLKGQPREVPEVLEMFRKAGRGLAAAHAAGLVHRDFKPDNVLVGRDGRVRVTDFGLARASASTMTPQVPLSREDLEKIRAGTFALDTPLTHAGSLLGTPAYMAPEQLQGRASDERTDQFGFCIALYEALYGERPLRGSTVATLTLAAELGLIRGAPQDSRVPEGLRRVLLRGLSAAPEDRFPSMEALLAQLALAPSRLRRRVLLPAALAAVVGVGVLGAWLLGESPGETRCPGAQGLLGVWDEDQKVKVGQAFSRAQPALAPALWPTLSRLLDGYAGAWVRAQDELCRADREDPPDDRFADRLSCLAQRRGELSALSRLLAEAAPPALELSVDAVGALTAPSDCLTTRSRGLLPPDEARRGPVEATRQQLSEARAQASLGHLDRARELAVAAQSIAQELGYRPLEAEAGLAIGDIEAGAEDPRAEAALQAALIAAEAGRHDEVAARAWMLLADGALRAGRTEPALGYTRHALATVEALGDSPGLEADALVVLARFHSARGEHAAAARALERALERQALVGGAPEPKAAAMWVALAQALHRVPDPGKAHPAAERGLGLHRQLYGGDHPRTRAARSALEKVAPAPP